MTTSATAIIRSETASRTLSPGTRAYFQARLRNRLYDLVLSKFRMEAKNTGLTRAELGRRIGRRPEVVTRLLGVPGNWTLDTVSDLLLGIAGEELDATSSSPFSVPVQNYGYAEVLNAPAGPAAQTHDPKHRRLPGQDIPLGLENQPRQAPVLASFSGNV